MRFPGEYRDLGAKRLAQLHRLPWLLSPLLCLLLVLAACQGAGEPASLEQRAQEIDRSLICPVCPGETIDQSQVELAKQMQAMVREKLAAGDSREQILAFFAERYGERVLAAPPKHGFSLAAWLIPPVVLLAGGIGLVLAVRRMRRSSNPPAQETRRPPEAGLEPYLSLVDQDLQGTARPGAQDAPGGKDPAQGGEPGPGQSEETRRG
ncbi:MAG: cytochrome c-type biogenesis protein CcmH [Chloroflexi bacterium]|nr:cytochrome c-type biogenesis protein CcmH [Chloroflexota bacterium]